MMLRPAAQSRLGLPGIGLRRNIKRIRRLTMLNGYLTRRRAAALLSIVAALLAVAFLTFAPPLTEVGKG